MIGTLLGVVVLATCAPLVAKLAMNVHSVDYLMLAIMGLMVVGALSASSVKFGLIAALLSYDQAKHSAKKRISRSVREMWRTLSPQKLPTTPLSEAHLSPC